MGKDISWYYKNCDSLTLSDIRNFIILLCNEEIKKLNIKTKIDIVFSDDIKDYGGSLTNHFTKDSSGNLVLPLETIGYTLEINNSQIIDSYLNCKNQVLEIFPSVKISKSLNVLSAIASLCAHEVRHAFQNEQIKNNNIDSVETILWLKLELIRNKFNTIYEDNYEDFFTEQDAYNYQRELPFSLLEKYSELDNDTLEKYKGYLKERKIVFCKSKNFKIYFKCLDEPSRKRIGIAYINELFNQIIKDLPREYISKSLLKYEYNSDGTKKTFSELMKDKTEYIRNGQNSDDLYDFIVDCDYNLKVQKIALDIKKTEKLNISPEKKEMLKECYIKDLKQAYYAQEFDYKKIHFIFQKIINKINKDLADMSIKSLKKQINFIEESNIRNELLIELSHYRAIEIEILNHIKDYKYQKEEYLKQEELYSQNMRLINDYKNKKGILDIIKDGAIVDVTDYNKLIASVIKELNKPNVDSEKKEYLLKVKEAIQMLYFPTTLEKEKGDRYVI